MMRVRARVRVRVKVRVRLRVKGRVRVRVRGEGRGARGYHSESVLSAGWSTRASASSFAPSSMMRLECNESLRWDGVGLGLQRTNPGPNPRMSVSSTNYSSSLP